MLKLIINATVGPAIFVIFTHYIGGYDWRESVLLVLIVTSIGNLIALIVSLIKIFFKAATFRFISAVKESLQLVYSLIIILLYWLLYFYVWGFDFSADIWQTIL